jgi:hypothetical protein
VKVPYVEHEPTRGGFGTLSEADVGQMIRHTVESWKPQRGPDWSDVQMRLAATGAPAWLIYTAASAVLILILFAAFFIGSALQLGALAPQPIPAHLQQPA